MPTVVAQTSPPSEVLDRVLAASGADGFDLPPLLNQQDEGPSWFERLMKWLQSLMPQEKSHSNLADLFPLILKTIAIVGMVMIVVALVSVLFNYFRRVSTQARDSEFGLKRGGGEVPREKLQLLLEEALRAGQTGLAARLRWKLYLMKSALPSSITPGETDGFGRYYPLMFGSDGEGAEAGALKLFNELDLSLRARENAPGGQVR